MPRHTEYFGVTVIVLAERPKSYKFRFTNTPGQPEHWVPRSVVNRITKLGAPKNGEQEAEASIADWKLDDLDINY